MTQKNNHSEKLLVLQLKENNEKAFRKLFVTYQGDIYNYCISLLKNKEYAEEIVQDVFLNVWKYRDRINPDLSFKSYIFTIARNHTFNFLNKASNNKKLKEEIFYKSQRYSNVTENMIMDREYEILKNKVIAKLSPKRKQIFLMSRMEGKSYQTISDELKISVSTVKTQMSRSLADIRSYLHQHSDLTWQLIFLAMPWFIK